MEEHKELEPRGTMVLAMVFFGSFILYYFLNWKWLSNLWYVR